MNFRSFVTFIALCFLFSVTGCQGSRGAGTPEDAAALQVINETNPKVIVDPASVQVVQTQPFDNSIYVVITYNRMWNTRDENCLMMTETHQEFLAGWVGGSGAGSCTERSLESEQPQEPMHLSGGTHTRTDQKKDPISHVLGRVNDPSIVKVNVVWQDGLSQEVEVIHGSFLAVRVGKDELDFAVGLNEENKEVYTVDH